MSVLKVKNGNQWDIVPAIKGDTGDPAADESITDDMLVTDGIKTEIEWLWGNQLMDSREGEILHAEDAYTAPAVDISVDGKSTQVTTTGKNLLNPDVANWPSKSVPGTGSRHCYLIPVETGTSYHWHRTGSNFYIGAAWCNDAELTDYQEIAMWTAVTDATVTNSGDYAYLLIYTNATDSAAFLNRSPIIEKGDAFTSYEPYTGEKPSPSPDYPQEITSLNECELMEVGNAQNLYQTLEWSDGYFNSAGNVVESNISEYTDDYIPVSVGDVLWYLSSCGKSLKRWIRLNVYNSEKVRVIGQSLDSPGSNYAINTWYVNKIQITDSRAAYIRISFDSYHNNPEYDYKCVFAISPITFSLLPDGYSLRSLPDGTKDELHLSYLRPSKRAGWAWYSRELVKRVGEFLAVSPNGWIKSNYASNGYYKSVGQITDWLGKPYTANAIISPWFKSANNLSEYFQMINSCWIDSAINFNIDPDIFSGTASEFGAWIAEHNIEFYMPLATPTTTQLDPIELPIMPSQTVNVWSDPATNLKMTYIQDTNLIIENLEATIADIATS